MQLIGCFKQHLFVQIDLNLVRLDLAQQLEFLLANIYLESVANNSALKRLIKYQARDDVRDPFSAFLVDGQGMFCPWNLFTQQLVVPSGNSFQAYLESCVAQLDPGQLKTELLQVQVNKYGVAQSGSARCIQQSSILKMFDRL